MKFLGGSIRHGKMREQGIYSEAWKWNSWGSIYWWELYPRFTHFEKESVEWYSSEEVCKLEFNYIDKAKTFYNMFIKVIGFSIQKDDLEWDKNGDIVSRKWVCSREGHWPTKCFENENQQH